VTIRLSVALLALMTALTVALSSADSATHEDGTPIDVLRAARTAPPDCGPAPVAAALLRFTSAFNRGDEAVLDRVLAPPRTATSPGQPEPDGEIGFAWYSVNSSGQHFVTYDRGEFWPYVRARRAAGEVLRPTVVVVNPLRGAGYVGISLLLERRAHDLGPQPLRVFAKGSFNCRSKTIFALSMAVAPADLALPCGDPSAHSPDRIVACTSGPTAWAMSNDFKTSGPRGSRACALDRVREGLAVTLSALNSGAGNAFAARFALQSGLSTSIPTQIRVVGRIGLRGFAVARFRSGLGWTAMRLTARTRSRHTQAASFAVRLEVSRGDALLEHGIATFSVDCKSGLLRSWRGP